MLFKIKQNTWVDGWTDRLAQTATFVSAPEVAQHFQVWPFYFEYHSNFFFL